MNAIMNTLPFELTYEIASYIPDDTTSETIYNIMKKALLPDEQIVENVSKYYRACREMIGDPRYEAIVLKYIKLYAFNHICNKTRDKFADEILDKKSIKKENKYIPYSKADEEFIKTKIYFRKEYYWTGNLQPGIRDILEEMFLGELLEINPNLRLIGISFTPILSHDSDISQTEIYNNGWEKHLPTLSDTTKYLTAEEKYLIRQLTVWYEYIFKILEYNLKYVPCEIINTVKKHLTEMRTTIKYK